MPVNSSYILQQNFENVVSINTFLIEKDITLEYETNAHCLENMWFKQLSFFLRETDAGDCFMKFSNKLLFKFLLIRSNLDKKKMEFLITLMMSSWLYLNVCEYLDIHDT